MKKVLSEAHRQKLRESALRLGLRPPPRKGVIPSKESREKMSIAHKGKHSGSYKGGIEVDRDGRVLLLVEIGQKKRKRAHLVAESALGRPLKKEEQVHHIDEDKANDNVSNLFVFKHNAAHVRWHHFLRRHSLDGCILESNLC